MRERERASLATDNWHRHIAYGSTLKQKYFNTVETVEHLTLVLGDHSYIYSYSTSSSLSLAFMVFLSLSWYIFNSCLLAGIQSVLFIICVSFVSPFDSRLSDVFAVYFHFSFHFFSLSFLFLFLSSVMLSNALVLVYNLKHQQISFTVYSYCLCACSSISERVWICVGMEC